MLEVANFAVYKGETIEQYLFSREALKIYSGNIGMMKILGSTDKVALVEGDGIRVGVKIRCDSDL